MAFDSSPRRMSGARSFLSGARWGRFARLRAPALATRDNDARMPGRFGEGNLTGADPLKSDVSVVTSKRDRCHGFIRLIGIDKVRIKTGDRDKASANRKSVDPFEIEGAISAGSGSFG